MRQKKIVMSDAQKVINFVDEMLIGLIVQRHEDEFTKAECYICECCHSLESDAIENVEHHPYCEVGQWQEFKKEFMKVD